MGKKERREKSFDGEVEGSADCERRSEGREMSR